MIRHFVWAALGAVLCSSTLACSDAEWVTLIDGARGIENFHVVGNANWRTEDEALVADAGFNSYMISKESFDNFALRAQFWADHTTNSAILIRVQHPQDVLDHQEYYEINIFDGRADASYGTGAIVNFAKVDPMPTAGGRWNTYEITADGPEITVVLNGEETVSIEDDSFKIGPIGLQYGAGAVNPWGGAIKWRKVEIRRL